jgi:oxygen-dependent protoporphyrinogen oxidase
VKRLGLESRIIHPPSVGSVVHGGRLVPAPEGFALLAPAKLWPLLASPLLSPAGKLRACAEPLIGPGKAAGMDESVASFVRRRFGRELFEHLAEPIAGAIYMADLERLSLAATFPRFQAMERAHGSVTRALRQAGSSSKPPVTSVAALEGGLGQIVDALLDRLPSGAVSLGTGTSRILRSAEGFVVSLADGRSLAAAGVLIATPAPAAASILRELDPDLAAGLAAIAFASCATVTLAWPAGAIGRPPESLGFFVPKSAGLELVAGTHLHLKFPNRAPSGLFLVRAFLGGAARTDISGQTGAELIERASRELTRLFGVTEPFAWSHVVRHSRTMPQPAVGHPELVARIGARATELPALELAGGPLGAYGLPDSIAAAEGAAERLWERLAAQAAW